MNLRRLVSLALLSVLIWYLSPMLFRSFTDSVLFYPERGQWRSPAALGLSFEEVWLDAAGERVQSWWVAGDNSGPVIVMFHGNGGTIADRLENVAELVARFGASVLQVEYPGYGDSSGRPSERSLRDAGEAGVLEASRRAGSRKVVLFGRSLGGAVAIDAATRHPVDGLVAESTFTNLRDMASASGIPLARFLVSYRFDSLTRIRDVTAPVMLLHGSRDEIVPYGMALRLLEAATNAPSKRLHTIEGGRHNDTWVVGGEEYWSAWADFLSATGDSQVP